MVLAKIYEETDNRQTEGYLKWYESKTGSIGRFPGHDSDSNVYYEHVSGPHCVAHRGYDGNAISVGEMRYCNTVQFIALYNHDGYYDSSQD
jgi:hypothetical protein